jgi:HAD superfamily phosphatase
VKEILVFDMDGVLVDVRESYRETICRTVEHFTGRPITRELVQSYKNQGGWNNDWALSHRIALDLGADPPYGELTAYFQRLFLGNGGDGLIARERWIPLDGFLDTLTARFRLAIFTGRPREEAAITLRRFGVERVFDPVVGDEDVARAKPAPDGLLRIAEAHPGANLLYVGDTIDDARSARAAGVPFIGVAARDCHGREGLVASFEAEAAVAVVENVNELPGVLR